MKQKNKDLFGIINDLLKDEYNRSPKLEAKAARYQSAFAYISGLVLLVIAKTPQDRLRSIIGVIFVSICLLSWLWL